MSILLNDNELNALEGLRDVLIRLYIFGIRKYMDYETGIVGIKRGISYQSVSEQLYEEPIAGFKTRQIFSRQQARRAVQALEKAGLILMQSEGKQLILECILATTDNSVQNKADTRPTQGRHKGRHKGRADKNKENPINTNVYEEHINEADTEADCSSFDYPPQADTPPLSDIRIYINNSFLRAWEKFPARSKGSKFKAAQKYQELLTADPAVEEKILQAIDDQHTEYILKQRYGIWCPEWKNFITWLNQKCWENDVNTDEEFWKNETHQRNDKKNYPTENKSRPQSKTDILWDVSAPGAFEGTEFESKYRPKNH